MSNINIKNDKTSFNTNNDQNKIDKKYYMNNNSIIKNEDVKELKSILSNNDSAEKIIITDYD